MDTHEMPVEAVAKPIPVLGLECKHLEHLVIVLFPRIVVEVQIQSRFLA